MYDRKEFQSTLPREERHKTISSIIESKYFNPRSHERSDRSSFPSSFISCISIHAPTRGATGIDLKSTLLITYFNPRSHERSDPLLHKRLYSQDISIHAPTRGATAAASGDELIKEFQSTLPREERQETSSQGCRQIYFNPRSHERSDIVIFFLMLRDHNFNPRSHERSDMVGCCLHFNHIYFNPRSHERSDPSPCCSIPTSLDFNPRSHERSDALLYLSLLYASISIHAPTRGATAILHKKFVYFYTIPTINI